MSESAVQRYQKLTEMSSPFHTTSTSSLHSLTILSEKIISEIEADLKYFCEPFERDLDITIITVETYLKYFTLELENSMEILTHDEIIQNPGVGFELFSKVKLIDKKFAPMVPGYVISPLRNLDLFCFLVSVPLRIQSFSITSSFLTVQKICLGFINPVLNLDSIQRDGLLLL